MVPISVDSEIGIFPYVVGKDKSSTLIVRHVRV